MRQRIRLLQELVSDLQYTVDEALIAETILARAVTRRLVPEVAFRNDLGAITRLEAEREALLARGEAMARTDELTGLANRRALEEEIRRELARARRTGHQVTLAMLDLDRFKDYNDHHGYPAGDTLLREAATAWRIAVRQSDFIGRSDGEEFIVILPDCSSASAAVVIERLRAATPDGQTVSGGIATWDGAESAESLLRRVDRALHAAKHAGRDRLITASAD
jgi:diguanylate cyclase (GGDEF)-like protein